jgi:ubiquinol-cytochrome c reductase cytochrome b subunit
VYVPAADQAYQSLQYLNDQAAFGWYLRAVHFWGSNGMVLVMTLHMLQVFLWGAYKYPRELTWIAGVLLFLCTLGMAFTGQILRWDQDAYWGLGIGASIPARR